MLSEEDYTGDDFIDAIEAVNAYRRLTGKSRARQSLVLEVLRRYADEDTPRSIGGLSSALLLELINNRKELRNATDNTLKQSDAGQADSTPSKPNQA